MILFRPNITKMLERKNINGLLKALDINIDRDKGGKILEEATQALGQIGDANTARSLVTRLKRGWGYLEGPIGIFVMAARRLGGAENKVAQAIGRIGSPAVVPDLLALLDHSDSSVQVAAIEALGELKSHDAVPTLIQGLQDQDSTKRMMCAWALGRIGDTRATLALRDRLNDNKAIVRSRVILALEALGDRDAVPAIKPLLLDSEVSCEAATALASLAGRGAIPDLLAALEASLNFPKEAAGWAIGGILDAIVGLQDSSVIPHLFQLKEGLLPRVSGNVQYVDSLKDVARERIEEVLQKLRQPQ